MIRVGVLGATGRMGRLVGQTIVEDAELTLVAAVNPSAAGSPIGLLIGHPEIDVPVSPDLDALLTAEAEVAVDFTTPHVVMDNVRWAIEHGVHIVVGTSGVGPADLQEIHHLIREHGDWTNVIVAPNFAIGAILMQRFAAEAARFYPAVEIIELHHDGKLDAPSGTSLVTAERIEQSRSAAWEGPTREVVRGVRGGEAHGVRIHSVRLPGLVGHQEVVFGGTGETLTIRHDSLARTSFMAGVIRAVKSVGNLPGLTVGLDTLLFGSPDD